MNQEKNRQNKTTSSKPNTNLKSKIFQSKNSESDRKIRVFKPNPDKLLKEKIKSSIRINKKKKQYLFGFKNFNTFGGIGNLIGFLKPSNLQKQLKLWLVKLGIIDKFNDFLAKLLIIGTVVFFVYLTFFDRYFLVKNYQIDFTSGSFLSEKELQSITIGFSQSKFLGFVPNNQFWFLNEYALTQIGSNSVPEIQKIDINRRIWPDTVDITVQTEPILATLSVVEGDAKKSWRISKTGRIITQDTAGIAENLIVVDRPLTIENFAGNTGQSASFQDYRLENNIDQVNRLWFVIWVKDILESFGIQTVATNFPSLSDTDVIITTQKGARLYFDADYNKIPKENMKLRIESILRTNIRTEMEESKISYIDFRVENKRVYVCYLNTPCQR